jgi:AcrR family transcriptional regulator
MPKIIDHDVYRLELAFKAAPLFSEYGYTGLGMRKIAKNLGISKSALYHYFPSKKALFHACTDAITRFEGDEEEAATCVDNQEEKLQYLFGFFKGMEPEFPKELSLLLDYLRGRTMGDIKNDPTMRLVNQRYIALIQGFVGVEDAKPVYCLLLGTLLARFFDAQTTDFDEIESWLLKNLK